MLALAVLSIAAGCKKAEKNDVVIEIDGLNLDIQKIETSGISLQVMGQVENLLYESIRGDRLKSSNPIKTLKKGADLICSMEMIQASSADGTNIFDFSIFSERKITINAVSGRLSKTSEKLDGVKSMKLERGEHVVRIIVNK